MSNPTKDQRCPHGVRHPHPCRLCEDAPLPSNEQLLQRVLVALNLAMSGFRAHKDRYGDGETTVAGKRAQAVIEELIPAVEAAAAVAPVETNARRMHVRRNGEKDTGHTVDFSFVGDVDGSSHIQMTLNGVEVCMTMREWHSLALSAVEPEATPAGRRGPERYVLAHALDRLIEETVTAIPGKLTVDAGTLNGICVELKYLRAKDRIFDGAGGWANPELVEAHLNKQGTAFHNGNRGDCAECDDSGETECLRLERRPEKATEKPDGD